ncbi:hypothetical protein U1Q18_024823 [Sarracenia purpurea var. burkii]
MPPTDIALQSHVDESILFPRDPSHVSSPQVEKLTYKEVLQGAIQPNTEDGPSVSLRGEENDEIQPEEGFEDPFELGSERELSGQHFRKSVAAEQKNSSRLTKAKSKMKIKSTKGKKHPKSKFRKVNYEDPVVEVNKPPDIGNIQVSQASITSSDIRNRNVILKNQTGLEAVSQEASVEDESSRLRKEAERALETGKLLGINFGDMEEDTILSFIDINRKKYLA